MFLARCSRPDIAYAVHYLSRFFASYDKVHWDAGKKILQYLQGTKEFGILYPSAQEGSDQLSGFVDAVYGSDKQSRKSTTGCLFHFNGAPVTWLSKRQTCIALSSTESEYIALSQAGKEAVWLSRLYTELHLSCFTDDSVCLQTDSQSAIKLAKNPEYHDKTKHIDIRHHYIRWLVRTSQVNLAHIPDTVQPADILTKAVVKVNFVKKRNIMGIRSPPPEAEKRKALSSVIVDPKRPNLFWTLALIFLGLTMMGSAQDLHHTGSPILWRRSHDSVVVGFNAINMNIKLVSPCSLLPTKNVEVRVANATTAQCNKAYEDFFLSKLETMCTQETSVFGRVKREPITITLIIIGLIASAGLAVSSAALSKVFTLETRQEELLQALNDLEKEVFVGQEKYEFLEKEGRQLTSVLDQVVAGFTIYREKVVELQYLIAYLIGKLLDGRNILKATEKSWRKKELSSDFFEYLNFTLRRANDCPIEHGTFHSCNMKPDRKQILLDFTVPVINNNLTRIEADAFDLMAKKENVTCRLKYQRITPVFVRHRSQEMKTILSNLKSLTHNITFTVPAIFNWKKNHRLPTNCVYFAFVTHFQSEWD